ncbi:DNA-binding domain-containing protein [Gloeothece verrucosa]|uniref:KilA-N, DNA-binding domain protein n=1 Tax=Gloeothece verrucosa (strain PCC 7822) TaxID=497965 RepID=E0UEM2_GLOV7|nr:DNA-binding domain-containing protein [Gloeothece verrucosa]ADN16590.1 KilA-N, DNA-binding domain protein [Gloeothece verrucosa PCC 7822]
MNLLSENVLIESATARNNQLGLISPERAQSILLNVKSLYFSLWRGTGISTTEQLADFFEVQSTATIRKVYQRHKDEFDADGVKTIRGKDLKDVRDRVSLTSTSSNVTLWTPRGALRLAMLLTDSEVAKLVRTSLLNAVEKVIPAQTQEIEKLKLELELAKTQERLLMTTQAIATLHGSEMVALILGKPEAIITKTERVETLIPVDQYGRAVSKYEGVGITYLAKRYGFGKNTKACYHWLATIGVSDEQWLIEPALVKSKKLPRDLLPWLDKQYANKKGTRQMLLGELDNPND